MGICGLMPRAGSGGNNDMAASEQVALRRVTHGRL